MKSKIVLVGAGGHSKSCIDLILQHGVYEIWGMIGLNSEVGKKYMNYEVLGDDSDLEGVVGEVSNALIAYGQVKFPESREQIFVRLKEIGFTLPTIISPRSYISPFAKINEGSTIFHDVLINSQATIGINCVVNTKSIVEHDAFIDDHTQISTGVIINGNTRVGRCSFIGSGSILRNNISLKNNSFIKMHSTITQDQ